MESNVFFKQLLKYQIHFSNINVEELENNIYKTNDDLNKIRYEFRRVSRKINATPELFEKYSYKLFELYNEMKEKGKYINERDINLLKCKIVELDILCGLKVGLVSVFKDDEITKNITFEEFNETFTLDKKRK